MRVAVFEPEAEGHHLALYTRAILTEMVARDWEVELVTTKRATDHPAFGCILPLIGEQVRVSYMADHPTRDGARDLERLRDQFKRFANYRNAFRALPAVDAVFMVNLDQADLPMAVLGSPYGSTPLVGILIGRQFHIHEAGIKAGPLKRRDKLMRPIFQRMLKIRSLKRVLVVDESFAMWAAKSDFPGAKKVGYLPDVASFKPLEGSHSPRVELGIPADAIVLLLYGALSERKGVADAIAAVAHPECPERVCLLLAGGQDAFVREAMVGPSATSLRARGRLFELNRFLDDEDESRAFQAADLVWLGYRHWFGSSGVLLQAATAGRAVLAMDQGVVGWLVDRHNFGFSIDTTDPKAVAECLATVVQNPAILGTFQLAGRELAAKHTPKLFGEHVCNEIAAVARLK